MIHSSIFVNQHERLASPSSSLATANPSRRPQSRHVFLSSPTSISLFYPPFSLSVDDVSTSSFFSYHFISSAPRLFLRYLVLSVLNVRSCLPSLSFLSSPLSCSILMWIEREYVTGIPLFPSPVYMYCSRGESPDSLRLFYSYFEYIIFEVY